MRKTGLFILCCLFAFVAQSQQRYSVVHYTNKDGLPANGITGMEWEANTGLLWIGTEGGLVRWDGNEFRASAETEGRVLQLGRVFGDSSRCFALCDDYSIYVIENGQIHKYRAENSTAQGDSTQAGFIKWCRSALKSKLLPSWLLPLKQAPADFLVVREGRIYYSEGEKVFLLRQKVEFVDFITIGQEVYLLDSNSLSRFDRPTRSLKPVRAQGFNFKGLRHLRNEEHREVMFYKGTTLFRLRTSIKDECSLETVFDALPSGLYPRFVRELPGQGLIILGDGINGMYMLRRKSIRQLTDSTGSISSAQLVTYGQALLPGGNVMTHSGLVYDRNGPIAGKTMAVQGSLQLVRFGNHVYFTQNGFLFRYNTATQTSEQFGTLDGSGYAVLAESGGYLYLIEGNGVARLEGDELREVYRFPRPGTVRPFSAVEWKPGIFLLGEGNSVCFLDIEKKQTRSVKVSDKAPVRFAWRNGKNTYLCTYGEGLFLLRNDSVYALPRDKSGYLRFAHAIVPDGRGFCYISSNNGLFRVSEKALAQAAGTAAPVCYYFLGKEEGLEQTELNGGCTPAFVRLPDGTLSFPTINGLAQLHPDSARIAPPSGIILVRATAEGRDLGEGGKRLDADTRLFQFDVTMPSWTAPQNLYGWYRLRRSAEPVSEAAWIEFDPVRQHQFVFTALKPDAYDFEVRTFNGFQPGNFAVRSYHFEIAPPWYAGRRAILLWVALGCLLIWAFVYLRTRQLRSQGRQLERTVHKRTRELEEQKQQLRAQLKLVSEAHDLKERLISVISHNIITPLRYIHRATTMMRDDARSLDPALREKAVDSINDTSLELELLSVNLLNWIKLQHTQVHVEPESFFFAEIADHVRGLLDGVAKSKGNSISINNQCTGPVYQFKDALQVIVYNLVLNAIAHSGGSLTNVTCIEEGYGYLLSVTDNGTGIPANIRQKLLGETHKGGALKETENQGKGFGFVIIRDLVHFIGGELTIENGKPGTHICVRFRAQLHAS